MLKHRTYWSTFLEIQSDNSTWHPYIGRNVAEVEGYTSKQAGQNIILTRTCLPYHVIRKQNQNLIFGIVEIKDLYAIDPTILISNS